MLASCAILFAQDETPKPVIYNQHKNEIAIDFQNLLHKIGNNVVAFAGTNLIYKKRFGEKRFVSVNEKKALRFQLGGYVDTPISSDTISNQLEFPASSYFNIKDSYTNLTTSIGIEWQKQYEERLQLFYGFDIGASYYRSSGIQSYTISSSSSTFTEGLSKDVRFPVYGFLGFKVFLHPRFSVSIESSINAGIGFEKNTLTRHDANAVEQKLLLRSDKRTEFIFNIDYLRYLNLSYYF